MMKRLPDIIAATGVLMVFVGVGILLVKIFWPGGPTTMQDRIVLMLVEKDGDWATYEGRIDWGGVYNYLGSIDSWSSYRFAVHLPPDCAEFRVAELDTWWTDTPRTLTIWIPSDKKVGTIKLRIRFDGDPPDRLELAIREAPFWMS